MPQFDLSAADPIFKVVFNPRVEKQFNTAAVLWNDVFEGSGTMISNRGLEIPVHMAGNGQHAWFSDGGALPAGDSQRVNRAIVGFYSYVKPTQFTGAALDAGGGGDATNYVKSLAFNVRNSVVDAIKELNIYSFLDGSGTLAKVGASVTLSTTVNTVVDVTGLGGGSRYLRPGLTIDFLTGTVNTVKGTATIVSLSNLISVPGTTNLTAAGGAVTITVGPASAAGTLAAGDAVISSGSFNKAMTGLSAIVDNGTNVANFQNINRAANPQYNANVIALSNTPALTRDYLRRAIWSIQQVRGAVDPGKLRIWSHGSQLHAYVDMGWTMKQFNGNAMKMDLGYTAFDFEGIPWVIDTDAPRDILYFLNKDSMLKTTARKLSFDDRTGSILNRVPTTTGGYNDAFVAYLEFRGNLGCYFPNSNTSITGLGIPAGY